eukprot:NODE_5708_length_259_cov_11.504762_g5263_i0.p4 GENE.NODE_5708_length_259_cov_11.504762_g5263_i0~~NODE_5708_length_259_cov_11.504762_g5263_i0.p4  ORF type:complete len:52 (-),score=11.93 NODE_5708_length_259_cov_11.504762_g5263_i0:102-230(-)
MGAPSVPCAGRVGGVRCRTPHCKPPRALGGGAEGARATSPCL